MLWMLLIGKYYGAPKTSFLDVKSCMFGKYFAYDKQNIVYTNAVICNNMHVS